jgi:hypothetical protein
MTCCEIYRAQCHLQTFVVIASAIIATVAKYWVPKQEQNIESGTEWQDWRKRRKFHPHPMVTKSKMPPRHHQRECVVVRLWTLE